MRAGSTGAAGAAASVDALGDGEDKDAVAGGVAACSAAALELSAASLAIDASATGVIDATGGNDTTGMAVALEGAATTGGASTAAAGDNVAARAGGGATVARAAPAPDEGSTLADAVVAAGVSTTCGLRDLAPSVSRRKGLTTV